MNITIQKYKDFYLDKKLVLEIFVLSLLFLLVGLVFSLDIYIAIEYLIVGFIWTSSLAYLKKLEKNNSLKNKHLLYYFIFLSLISIIFYFVAIDEIGFIITLSFAMAAGLLLSIKTLAKLKDQTKIEILNFFL